MTSLNYDLPTSSRSILIGNISIFKNQNKLFSEAITEYLSLATKSHVNKTKELHKDTLYFLMMNCLVGFASWQYIATPSNIERSRFIDIAKLAGLDNRRLKRCLHALAGGEDFIDVPTTGLIFCVQKD